MKRTKAITDEIIEILAADGTGYPIASVAEEFLRAFAEAQSRLEQCATMISKGSEYQALQLAETPPALLDQIAALSFAQLPDWIRFCEQRQLPTPRRFDDHALNQLNEIYSKGISADHSLYREYRAAISKRDDSGALQILETITKLNPSDTNASSEIARLKRKLFQGRVGALKIALDAGARPEILEKLRELEAIAQQEQLSPEPVYQEACRIEADVRRENAQQDAAQLVGGLANLKASGFWRRIPDVLAQIGALQNEHGFTLTSSHSAVVEEMRSHVASQQRALEADQEFSRATRGVENALLSPENRHVSRGTAKALQVDSELAELNRAWKEVERFQRSVPGELLDRVQKVVANLRTEQDSHRGRKRIIAMVSAVAALVILAVSGFFAFRFWTAKEYAARLTDARASGQVEEAEQTAARLRGSRLKLADSGPVRTVLAEAEKWCADQRLQFSEVQQQLDALGAISPELYNKEPLQQLVARVVSLETATGQMADGIRGPLEAPLAAARTRLDGRLMEERKTLEASTLQHLAEAESAAVAMLNADVPVADFREAAVSLNQQASKLTATTEPIDPALRLSPEIESRIHVLAKKTQAAKEELEKFDSALVKLGAAGGFKDFYDALEAIKVCRFSDPVEIRQAATIAAHLPEGDQLMGMLLSPGDEKSWLAAKQDTGKGVPIPADVLPAELKLVLAFRDHKLLRNIYFATMNGRTRIYSKGPIVGPREVIDPVEGRMTTWEGDFYDPNRGATVNFAPGKYSYIDTGYVKGGTRLTDISLTSASTVLDRLGLDRLFNDQGTSYQRSMLEVFETLGKETGCPVLFRAYAYQELMRAFQLRPEAWGAEYSPLIQQDFTRFKAITEAREIWPWDWYNATGANGKLEKQLKEFFESAALKKYRQQVALNRSLVSVARATEVVYAGYVGPNKAPRVVSSPPPGSRLYCLSEDFSRAVPLPDQFSDSQILSPLFYLPINREDSVASAFSSLGANPNDQALLDNLPAYFRRN